MIPNQNAQDGLINDFEEVQQTSRTYKLDYNNMRVVGYIDNIKSVEQFIVKTLGTERYEWEIYSWNYAAEINKLFGKPMSYAYSEVKRLIYECLMQDDRINNVTFLKLSHYKNNLTVEMLVETIFGDLEYTTEVQI